MTRIGARDGSVAQRRPGVDFGGGTWRYGVGRKTIQHGPIAQGESRVMFVQREKCPSGDPLPAPQTN